ncbi:MAG TPA: hypothetical protein PLU53_03785 [Bacteroidia bacterium]|nr:hypothetical protein [Bacteroidia bacterium]
MKKLIFISLLFLLLFASSGAVAQCSMCRRVTETNVHDGGNKVGKKLNSGILYLLAIPYLIGAVGAFTWYKNRNKS